VGGVIGRLSQSQATRAWNLHVSTRELKAQQLSYSSSVEPPPVPTIDGER